jgi:RNA polymerase sigma factor (sigma-70 family)
MHFRKEGRRGREVELTEESIVEIAPSQRQTPRGADGALLQSERRLQVHMVLDLLKPHYRRVLAWKYFEELPVKEIAQRLNVGPKAAESLLTRARKSFREAHEHLLSSFETRGTDS